MVISYVLQSIVLLLKEQYLLYVQQNSIVDRVQLKLVS